MHIHATKQEKNFIMTRDYFNNQQDSALSKNAPLLIYNIYFNRQEFSTIEEPHRAHLHIS